MADKVRVRVARHWCERLRGALGATDTQAPWALLLTPCWAVHTCGMRIALTVYFLDRRGRCLRRLRRLPPWRCAWHWRAYAVLEVPVAQVKAGGQRALLAAARAALDARP